MLHTVNKSPTDRQSLFSCLRLAAEGSDILLIEDGVYASMAGATTEPLLREAIAKFSIHVLGPDLKCRGLSAFDVISGIELVDYDGFVSLAVRNSSIHSWL